MKVLSIGTDRKIFEQGSGVRERMIAYGKLFTELHIIVFSLQEHGLKAEKISDNVWVYPTNSRNKFFYPFSANRLFKREMAGVAPDVVTAQDPFETGLAGLLIARRIHKPLHIQIHTDFLSSYFKKESPLNYIRVMIGRWLLPQAAAIRAVSERVRTSLAAIDKNLPARTTVLPIYTDVEKFSQTTPSLDLHTKYPQFSFIIVMVSRLTSEKNIGYALNVFRDVVIKHPDAGLVIVGEGPEKRYLQGLALKHSLDRNVVFEGWQKDLASYYQTADLFLTTSKYEGYGLTFIEAQTSGCPIVSSDVGIAREIIENGKTGYVCDLAHPEEFVEKIRAIIENDEIRTSMRAAIKDVIAQHIRESHSTYLEKYKASIEAAVRS